MPDLREYDRKRDFKQTPEPGGEARGTDGKRQRAKRARFVIQEHHARRLHWDFRLERDGVLVSWAVPKGIPPDPRRNNLAVHVEDHPLDYIDFHGEIPSGNYGAGQVYIWDKGTYEEHKFRDDEVMVTLHGKRVRGRYVLFRTRGDDWMIHRMDPPDDPEREPMPEAVDPMLAKLELDLPSRQDLYAYEFKWDGIRSVAFIQGGRLRLQSRKREDITRRYPELRALAEGSGGRELVLDGEVIALDGAGKPSFEQLQQRMGLNSDSEIRRVMQQVPVYYMVFDLLYVDGRSTMQLPYTERRGRLEELKLAGSHWQTPPYTAREGTAMKEASRLGGLEGVVCKRLDSQYEAGRRSGAWTKVKHHRRQEVVIGGWLPGEGKRRGHVGALLVGFHEDSGLVYAGKVGTGFSESMLDRLDGLLKPLATKESPFQKGAAPPRQALFVTPELVAEVEFTEWTKSKQLRHPSFKGLRNDKSPAEVVREEP